jgi:nitrogen fixation protein FixH
MTDTPAAESGFRVKGWHVLAGIVSFFAVVITVDVIFTVIALKTFPGQVSVTPYEDGLLYNRKIARLTQQEELGWRAGAAAEPGGVVVKMLGADGQPLEGLSVRGSLQRPATEAGRVVLTFREEAPGRYAAPAAGLAGAWDLTAEAVDAQGRRFEAGRRLEWP